MIVTIKNTTNLEEIQHAIQYNQNVHNNYAGQGYIPGGVLMQVPKPIYEEVQWSFHLRNLQDFYVEDKEPKDIIANILYKGIMRIKYEPGVHAQFETYMSLGL